MSFDADGSRVSTGSTDGETVEASIGNGTDSEGGTISDIVTGTYGTDSKNAISADTKYFLVKEL